MYLGHNMRYTNKDKVCVTVPLYHCFGMVIGNLVALNFGAGVIYPSEGFDPVTAMECITKYEPAFIYGVPTMFIAMLREYAKNKSKYDIKSLRSGFIAGSTVPEAVVY